MEEAVPGQRANALARVQQLAWLVVRVRVQVRVKVRVWVRVWG